MTNITKEGIVQHIRLIIAHKQKELTVLKNRRQDHLVDYAILEQEIKDAEYLLEASLKERDEFLTALTSTAGQTTSSSIYDAIGPYLEQEVGYDYYRTKELT